MLKNRLIPIIAFKNDRVVQSFNFERFLPIGNIKTAIEFFVNWDVDEIIIIDIDATRNKRQPRTDIIEFASKECFVPLTYGGGINSIDHVKQILRVGCDKICINSIALEQNDFIKKSSFLFGKQCITVSIDAKKIGHDYYVFKSNGKINTNKKVADWAKLVEEQGAGEILIKSIDYDGSRKGYDLDLLKLVSSSVSVPVIASSGVGTVKHLADGILKGGCQAVSASNIFHHTEHSTIAAKSYLSKEGIPIRLDSDVKYNNFDFDETFRPI